MNCISLGMLIYLQWYRPFENDAANNIETFNELTVIFLTYFLFCFTDFVPEPEIRSDLGSYYNYVTFTNIAVHMFLMLRSSFSAIRLKIRRKCHAKKMQRILKDRQALYK